jgi:Holliday junction resolvase RusA-like endonuclease
MSGDVAKYAEQVAKRLSVAHKAFGGDAPPFHATINRAPYSWRRHAGQGASAHNPKRMRAEKAALRDLLRLELSRWERAYGASWPNDAYYRVAIFPGVTRFASDVDNYAKMVLDAAQPALWVNDRRVIDLHVKQVLCDHPHWTVAVEILKVAGAALPVEMEQAA